MSLAKYDKRSKWFEAAERGDGITLRAMLESGMNPNEVKQGETALCLVVRSFGGTIAALDALLSPGSGVDLEFRNQVGKTPLILAAGMPNRPIAVDKLLRAGADPRVEDFSETTALEWALLSGSDEAAMLLGEALNWNFEFGAWNFLRKDGRTPLGVAASMGNEEFGIRLLEMGADPNEEYANSWACPLIMAAKGGRSKLVLALLTAGADVYARASKDLATALHVGAHDSETTSFLLSAGAAPNALDSSGRTPLDYAVSEASGSTGDLESVAILLAAGANFGSAPRPSKKSLSKRKGLLELMESGEMREKLGFEASSAGCGSSARAKPKV